MNVMQNKSLQGQRAYAAGKEAEGAVLGKYLDAGATLLEERWRGLGGEIDLIIKDNTEYVFVEVKRAQTLDIASHRLQPAQILRIADAASEYLDQTPNGQLSPVRFDLALVDAMGQVLIQRNAFGHF